MLWNTHNIIIPVSYTDYYSARERETARSFVTSPLLIMLICLVPWTSKVQLLSLSLSGQNFQSLKVEHCWL